MGIEDISYPDEYSPERRAREFFLKIYTSHDLYASGPYSQLANDVEEAIELDNAKFRKVTGSDDEGKFEGTIKVTLEYIP